MHRSFFKLTAFFTDCNLHEVASSETSSIEHTGTFYGRFLNYIKY